MSKAKHYPEINARADFPKLEKEILAFWDAEKIFNQTIENRASAPEYVFYDGPAFGNGLPHYGHILTSYVKDLVPRYQTMRGKKVPRNIGWDCHGLPAELEAEKYLKISGKAEIAKFGIKEFNAVCTERVQMYVGEWEKFLTRMGRWIDYSDTYRTMDLNYTESVIWAFKKLYDKGLIYEGTYSIWYSYGAESTVSNSETKQDDCYREREDTSVTVSFLLDEEFDGKPTHILAWTTTPWTLVANFALCVGEDIDYAVMEENNQYYVIGDKARERYKQQLQNASFVKTVKGRDLVGKTYTPLFDFFGDVKHAFKVVSADYVTIDDGTGIVHLAPFGEEDLIIMEREAISWHAPVDSQGKFTKQVGQYAGMLVFDAIDPIVSDLKKSGKLIKKEQYRHMYPHCWRTGVPLINMPLNSWYVAVDKFRDRIGELNKKIDWIPDHIRDGQMGKWLAGARPWAISRSRFFGAPIPVWKSDNPEYPRIDVYGSIAELERDFGIKITDFHRPYIDELTRPNPDDPTGKSMMRRIPEVLDCWFESGAMPFASKHYPFENKDWFDSHFPADFIVEYIAQTRGWFYNMMILATALFDNEPFKTSLCHGVVLGNDGKKMSKSLRNYPDPMDVIETLGSDSLRWFLMSSTILSGGNMSVAREDIAKSAREVIMPLWNTFYFFTLYANAEGIKAKEIATATDPLDKYILSKLRTMVLRVTELLDASRINEAAPLFSAFMEILNNWYIRRSRPRFWDGKDTAAFDTLYTVLTVLSKALAPYMPMTAEFIYKSLTGDKSVHLQNWPDVSAIAENHNIEKAMDIVQSVVAVGKALRENARLRNRLPLAKMTIAGADLSEYADIIKDELNVKSVEFTTNISSVADSFVYLITPKIGERLGGALKEIIPAVKAGNYEIKDGQLYVLCPSSFVLRPSEYENRLTVKPGITGAALPDNTAVVVLDTNLTPELIAEGLANDALRFIQDTRKLVGLDVSDRIHLTVAGDAEMIAAFRAHEPRIAEDVLALDINYSDGEQEHKTEIENHKFSIKIEK
ncbi:MAG: isoleucine--tRNA ligase [Rickettsiales bacterium]|jgi:isoleucyl-tRNA synthetase|nr:isoleucine--tRNA ligase [Rickettsiales bacterium]